MNIFNLNLIGTLEEAFSICSQGGRARGIQAGQNHMQRMMAGPDIRSPSRIKDSEALAQVTQRGGGSPNPADTHGQAGWGSRHPMELWLFLFTARELDQRAFKGPSNSRFYHSMISTMLHCQQLLDKEQVSWHVPTHSISCACSAQQPQGRMDFHPHFQLLLLIIG